ncbi:hypothetical protein B0F90DRAFT_1923123 [Multifurca ochricompacta]|uniref:Thyroglobulin type-1 domain-containing protein n=1 Tax=Multifurca ochricompacta TaxID=376703 RepID=A0AAD4QRR9_9AGAM|nr:hypothetical protein B0F90DRAFT_1923123 [Multifurca ochricompacta]
MSVHLYTLFFFLLLCDRMGDTRLSGVCDSPSPRAYQWFMVQFKRSLRLGTYFDYGPTPCRNESSSWNKTSTRCYCVSLEGSVFHSLTVSTVRQIAPFANDIEHAGHELCSLHALQYPSQANDANANEG